VALAAAIEAKRVADLAAPWQAQLALTDAALITANTVVYNAASVMNSDAELSSKTTAVEASKQANAVFISEIQALKLVERDATDGAVTTAFTAQQRFYCRRFRRQFSIAIHHTSRIGNDSIRCD
jgi:hypothetical protein